MPLFDIRYLILTMINRCHRQPLRLREQDLLAGAGRSRAATGQSLAVHPDGCDKKTATHAA